MEYFVKPYEIKNNIQLLLDNDFLDDYWQIRRAPELPVKSNRNPVLYDKPPFSPGGPTVLYDKEEKIFKCWYGVADSGKYYARLPDAYRMCYAVSNDGINWEKPDLGLYADDIKGKNNNLVFNNPGAVNKDIYEQNPERKYKMLYIGQERGTYRGLCAAFSPDGIHWNKHEDRDYELIPGSNDTNNMAIYDPSVKKYIRYGRLNVLSSIEKEEDFGILHKKALDILRYRDTLKETREIDSDFPDFDTIDDHFFEDDYINRYLHATPHNHLNSICLGSSSGCSRRIVRSESSDFLNWSTPELVLAPDELDPPKFYGMTVCIYEGFYIGLLQVYNSSGNKRIIGSLTHTEGDTIDIQLVFSRDGIKWERLANRPVYIPRGYIGSYDGGMILGSNIPIVEYNDFIMTFYTGTRDCHTVSLDSTSSVCVARSPKGRLISRCAGNEMGAILTKPFILNHNKISLNLDSSRGMIKVELTDLKGKPIEGYSCSDSDEIKLNHINQEITWNGCCSLDKLKGTLVRMRLYLWKAKLYSINFCD